MHFRHGKGCIFMQSKRLCVMFKNGAHVCVYEQHKVSSISKLIMLFLEEVIRLLLERVRRKQRNK